MTPSKARRTRQATAAQQSLTSSHATDSIREQRARGHTPQRLLKNECDGAFRGEYRGAFLVIDTVQQVVWQ